MALNDDAPPPPDDLLALAAAQLRTHTDEGWVAVAPPPGWTPQDTERIRDDMNSKADVDGPPV